MDTRDHTRVNVCPLTSTRCWLVPRPTAVNPFCFTWSVSLGTSPNSIDREGLGKMRTRALTPVYFFSGGSDSSRDVFNHFISKSFNVSRRALYREAVTNFMLYEGEILYCSIFHKRLIWFDFSSHSWNHKGLHIKSEDEWKIMLLVLWWPFWILKRSHLVRGLEPGNVGKPLGNFSGRLVTREFPNTLSDQNKHQYHFYRWSW